MATEHIFVNGQAVRFTDVAEKLHIGLPPGGRYAERVNSAPRMGMANGFSHPQHVLLTGGLEISGRWLEPENCGCGCGRTSAAGKGIRDNAAQRWFFSPGHRSSADLGRIDQSDH